MNILLIGPQGSGKGTQAQLLVGEFGLYYVESGEILRAAAKSDPVIDRLINKEGKLLPDDITFRLVTDKLERERPQRDGILFDGFPRSVSQFELLDDWLSQMGKKINLTILIEISEEVSVKRLSARRIDPTNGKIYNLVTEPPPPEVDINSLVQREDDKPEAIKKRLELYKQVTGPLVERLDAAGTLKVVGGERPIEIIYEEISKAIKNGH
jgi:adenylate kinase